MTLTVEIPDDLEALQRERLAVVLYDARLVSQGKAARIAGLSRAAFIDALGKYGVTPFQYDADEILAEVEMLRPMDERLHDEALQRPADHEEQSRHRNRGEDRIDMQRSEEHEGRIHRQHGEFAVGEIDDAHDAEDHRQPERHQPVDEPSQQPADGNVEIDVERHEPGPLTPVRPGMTMRACRMPASAIRAWRSWIPWEPR